MLSLGIMDPAVARRSRRAFDKIRRLPSGGYQASCIGEDDQRCLGPTTFALKKGYCELRVGTSAGDWGLVRSAGMVTDWRRS